MKYDVKVRGTDTNKISVNELLGSETKKVMPRINAKDNALILDTSMLLTTKTLMSIGFEKNNIQIPNFSSDYHKIKKKHRSTFHMSMEEYLNLINELEPTEYQKQYGVVFFDYCCSVLGNKTVNPESDIKKVFEMRLFKDKSIFATTFSFRNGKMSNYEAVSTADYYITKYAYENDYVAVKLPASKAYNGMFFSMYQIMRMV